MKKTIDAWVFLFKGKYYLCFATRNKNYKIQMQGVVVVPENINFSREDWNWP